MLKFKIKGIVNWIQPSINTSYKRQNAIAKTVHLYIYQSKNC